MFKKIKNVLTFVGLPDLPDSHEKEIEALETKIRQDPFFKNHGNIFLACLSLFSFKNMSKKDFAWGDPKLREANTNAYRKRYSADEYRQLSENFEMPRLGDRYAALIEKMGYPMPVDAWFLPLAVYINDKDIRNFNSFTQIVDKLEKRTAEGEKRIAHILSHSAVAQTPELELYIRRMALAYPHTKKIGPAISRTIEIYEALFPNDFPNISLQEDKEPNPKKPFRRTPKVKVEPSKEEILLRKKMDWAEKSQDILQTATALAGDIQTLIEQKDRELEALQATTTQAYNEHVGFVSILNEDVAVINKKSAEFHLNKGTAISRQDGITDEFLTHRGVDLNTVGDVPEVACALAEFDLVTQSKAIDDGDIKDQQITDALEQVKKASTSIENALNFCEQTELNPSQSADQTLITFQEEIEPLNATLQAFQADLTKQGKKVTAISEFNFKLLTANDGIDQKSKEYTERIRKLDLALGLVA